MAPDGAAPSSVRVLYHLMRADFLERVRRNSFLITLALVVYLGYAIVRDQFSLRLGDYRGVLNSAWVGAAVAIVGTTVLSLVGFYLVKNSVERDERTRVGEILASTRMSSALYTLGKTLSNFAVLSLMVVILAAAAAAMLLLRREEPRVDLWALWSPFVLLALPALAGISALAVLFEVVGFLRGGLGNTVYIGVWMGYLIGSYFTPALDLLGTRLLWTSMGAACRARYPAYNGAFSIGARAGPARPLQPFYWSGIDWTAQQVASRLAWFAAAVGLALLAAFLFRRFDPAFEWRGGGGGSARTTERGPADETPGAPADALGDAAERSTTMASPGIPSPGMASPGIASPDAAKPGTASPDRWTPARLSFGFRDLLVQELRLAVAGLPWWWFVVVLGLVVVQLILPPAVGSRSAGLAAWIWPIPVWAAMGGRELRHGTQAMVYSSARPLRRQLPSTWLAGVLVAVAVTSGLAIRILLAGDGARLFGWVAAVLFVPSLALALGTWSGGSRLFEVIYSLWWYMGPLNQIPPLDYVGAWPETLSAGIPAWYFAAIVPLLAAAFLGRQWRLRS